MNPNDPKYDGSRPNDATRAKDRAAEPPFEPPIDERDTEELEPENNPYRETPQDSDGGEKSSLLIDESSAETDPNSEDDEISPFDLDSEPVRKTPRSGSPDRNENLLIETETDDSGPAVFRLEEATPDEGQGSSLLLDDSLELTGAADKTDDDEEISPLDLEDDPKKSPARTKDRGALLAPTDQESPDRTVAGLDTISDATDDSDDSLPSLLLVDEQEYAAAPTDDAERPEFPDVDLRLVSIDDEEDADESPARGTDTQDEGVESGLLLEESEDEALADPEEASAPPKPRPKDDSDRSRLLADIGDLDELETAPTTPLPQELDTDPGLDGGGSSLLLDSATAISGSTPATPAPAKERKRRRLKRERVKVAPPKLSQKIEWFANPIACAEYCRKHKRPLLLYFTPGDMDRSESYEEAIRMPEVQPFLSPYVCCVVDTRQAAGREVALRMGLPPDEPAMVVLSPRGHEFARVRKPVVDWQFIATMLFWALR